MNSVFIGMEIATCVTEVEDKLKEIGNIDVEKLKEEDFNYMISQLNKAKDLVSQYKENRIKEFQE